MATIIKCDLCSREQDRVAAKLYFTPVLPGKPAIMANYAYHCDVCSPCAEALKRKMHKRKSRSTGEFAKYRKRG